MSSPKKFKAREPQKFFNLKAPVYYTGMTSPAGYAPAGDMPSTDPWWAEEGHEMFDFYGVPDCEVLPRSQDTWPPFFRRLAMHGKPIQVNGRIYHPPKPLEWPRDY